MDMETLYGQSEKFKSKCILEGPRTLTYGDLISRCRKVHSFLKSRGFQSGDRIGIAATNEPEVCALVLSCLRLGYEVAMIDAGAKLTEAKAIIQNLELKALFIDPELLESWTASNGSGLPVPFIWPMSKQKAKLITRLLGKKENAPETYPDCLNAYEGASETLPGAPTSDRPALMLCTSGTTGLPKILQLSYGNLIAAAKTTSSKLGLGADSRVLNLLPLTHYDGIISGLFTTFWNSATMIRIGPFAVSLLPDIFDAIYKYRATHLLLTPSILALMLRLGEEVTETFSTDDFQFVISVAATLPSKLWSDFQEKTGKKIVNVYGLSETGNNLFAGPDDECFKIGSIGKPVDCGAIIINDEGSVLGNGETGELLLNGAGITSGYLGQPVETKKVDGIEWFATGDLAYRDDDGIYWLAGRKKNIIIVGGRNVYPDEVNNALLSHPSIIEIATLGLPDEIWGERVVCCVVAGDGITSESLIEHAKMRLADYKTPREIHLLPELPRGRSGKVLVNELAARLQAGTLAKKEEAFEKLDEQIIQLASQSFHVPVKDLSLLTAPQNCSSWDSVAHMDFVVNLETTFKIELLPGEVIQLTTLDSALKMIRKKLAEPAV